MANKEYIAYQGSKFTIEWYFGENGESQPLSYFNQLEASRQNQILALFKLMAEMGKIQTKEKFRNEGDKIYAFKPQPDRFLGFFFKDKKIIVTNAFEKKQDKLPPREKDKALKCKERYELVWKEDNTMTEILSTFDRIMKEPGRAKSFDEDYKELLLSELDLALREEDEESVSELLTVLQEQAALPIKIQFPIKKDDLTGLKSFFLQNAPIN